MSNGSPIIILGMHRSGTTMLTKILESMGLFVGDKKRKNYEATFFQHINKWLLYQANTTWDFPTNFRYVDTDYNKSLLPYVKEYLGSPLRIKYWGKKNFVKSVGFENAPFPWAWKDPVNCITIDFWKTIFPDAKLIHIYRNPIDVAESLRLREGKRNSNRKLTSGQKIRKYFLHRDYKFVQSYYVQNIDNGINLWIEYERLNRMALMKYESETYSIKYEDFLLNPMPYLEELTNFCNLESSKLDYDAIIKPIDSTKRFQFLSHKQLVNKYHEKKHLDLFIDSGYNNIV